MAGFLEIRAANGSYIWYRDRITHARRQCSFSIDSGRRRKGREASSVQCLRYNLVQKAAVQVTVQAFLQIREKFTMFSGQIQEASSSQISMGYSSPPVPSRSSLVPLLLLFSGDSSLMDAFLLGISLTTAVDDVTGLTSPRKSFHCRNLGGFQATERFYQKKIRE